MSVLVILYTEILNGKVVSWCFFLSEMSEKIHNHCVSDELLWIVTWLALNQSDLEIVVVKSFSLVARNGKEI